jgi:hypothetical protein
MVSTLKKIIEQPQPLRIYCGPISGGAITAELALLREIAMARAVFDSNPDNIKPHIFLGSSGGNIAGYIGLAGGWNSYGITRVSRLLEPEMLVTSWWPRHLDFLPTSLLGVFSGSLYREGYGCTQLFKNLFTYKKITDVEMWTGCFSLENNKGKLWTNKCEGETFINRERFEKDRELYNYDTLTYTNGDIDLLSQISVASASIPVLVSHQKIRGMAFVDGGSCHCSPLSVLSGEIFRIVTGDYTSPNCIPQIIMVEDEIKVIMKGDVEEKNKVSILKRPSIKKYKLQLTYFSCYDIDGTLNIGEESRSVLSGAGDSITNFVESISVIDRAKGVELLRAIAGKDSLVKHKHHSSLSTIDLSFLLQEALQYSHYFLNLYPHGRPSINMISFTGEDIITSMDTISKEYGAHLWYIE